MFKFVFLFMIFDLVVCVADDTGIFPGAKALGLSRINYWRLCGELGILGGYLFWSQVFK